MAFDGGVYEEVSGRTLSNGSPEGWGRFTQADGKFILGSDSYPSKEQSGRYPLRYSGGSATHTLTVNEMPKHSHELKHLYYRNAEGDKTQRLNYSKSENAGLRTSVEGKGEPHNNMPPCIALYFCKKQLVEFSLFFI